MLRGFFGQVVEVAAGGGRGYFGGDDFARLIHIDVDADFECAVDFSFGAG